MTDESITAAFMTDSSKSHTGFGQVGREIAQGLHDAGIKVTYYGFLDHEPDTKGVLPYEFRPSPILDDLCHQTFGFFLREKRPDVVFIITDPGNLWIYLDGMVNREESVVYRNGIKYMPPVVAYTPIEGSPSPLAHGQALKWVQDIGGSVVLYCESAKAAIHRQFPQLATPYVVNHGLDHFKAQRYSEDDRKMLRQLVGLDDYFVIGSIGVNKRTKGFPTLIYTAAYLRSLGLDKKILFYLHTNPYEDTMWGYKLHELVKYYGVEDMFIFKPDIRDNYWLGTERDTGTLEQARSIAGKVPDTAEGRGFLFGQYDFISRLNCLDLYVDASQIEGWGLPLGEAMACGVPSISVHDNHVRDEVYKGGCYQIDPLPHHLWDTWHSGMRLVTINPNIIAKAILEMKADKIMRDYYSREGMKVAGKYKWADTRAAMVKIVKETVAKDREAVRAYQSKAVKNG